MRQLYKAIQKTIFYTGAQSLLPSFLPHVFRTNIVVGLTAAFVHGAVTGSGQHMSNFDLFVFV